MSCPLFFRKLLLHGPMLGSKRLSELLIKVAMAKAAVAADFQQVHDVPDVRTVSVEQVIKQTDIFRSKSGSIDLPDDGPDLILGRRRMLEPLEPAILDSMQPSPGSKRFAKHDHQFCSIVSTKKLRPSAIILS